MYMKHCTASLFVMNILIKKKFFLLLRTGKRLYENVLSLVLVYIHTWNN